jgi:hypothetical protein
MDHGHCDWLLVLKNMGCLQRCNHLQNLQVVATISRALINNQCKKIYHYGYEIQMNHNKGLKILRWCHSYNKGNQ